MKGVAPLLCWARPGVARQPSEAPPGDTNVQEPQGEPGVSNVSVSVGQLPRWLSVLGGGGGVVRFSLSSIDQGNLAVIRGESSL